MMTRLRPDGSAMVLLDEHHYLPCVTCSKACAFGVIRLNRQTLRNEFFCVGCAP